MQLAYNLSKGVTDTLESSLILIYSRKHMSFYTQSVGRMPRWLNSWLKVDESQKQELWIKSEWAEENGELVYNKIFCADTKILIWEVHKTFCEYKPITTYATKFLMLINTSILSLTR